jgi:hypothetical protein
MSKPSIQLVPQYCDVTMPRPKRERLHRKSREAARFTAAVALSFDLLLVGFSLWGSGSIRSQFVQLLPPWDLVKGVAIVALLVTAALRARSWLLGAFALVFALIVGLEEATGYGLATWALAQLGMDPDTQLGGSPAFVYAELVVLIPLALVALLIVWIFRPKRPLLRTARFHLTILLAILFQFSVVVGFLAEYWNSDVWALVEELGEMASMSLVLGYAVGLAIHPYPR